MEFHHTNPIKVSIKRWIFGLSIVLLCASALGYSYWLSNPIIAQATETSPDKVYYEQLVFVVNEISNQIERYESLRGQGALSLNDINKGEIYVNALMSPLTSAPEELSVSQSITEDLFNNYQLYVAHLKAGSSLLPTSYEQATMSFELFRQNADMITLLNAYLGVNVECH